MNPLLHHFVEFVKPKIRRFGFDIICYADQSSIFKDIDLLVDAGAYTGESYDYFRRMGYRGKISSFEPDPVSFSKLLRHPGYSWERQQLALSFEPGKKCFTRAPARETVFMRHRTLLHPVSRRWCAPAWTPFRRFKARTSFLRLTLKGMTWRFLRARAVCWIRSDTCRWKWRQRRAPMVHFLRVQEEAKTNWMKEKPPVPLWRAGVYCVTFIGPLWHTARGLVRDRDVRWLWHAPACLGSVLGNAWGVWTYKMRRLEKI